MSSHAPQHRTGRHTMIQISDQSAWIAARRQIRRLNILRLVRPCVRFTATLILILFACFISRQQMPIGMTNEKAQAQLQSHTPGSIAGAFSICQQASELKLTSVGGTDASASTDEAAGTGLATGNTSIDSRGRRWRFNSSESVWRPAQ